MFETLRHCDTEALCVGIRCSLATGQAIGFLWDLPEIQETFKRRYEFAFCDNMDYFFNKAELLYLEDYTPSQMDALRTRFRTKGLVDRRYEIKEHFFHIYDVGGQRKWVPRGVLTHSACHCVISYFVYFTLCLP